MAWTFTKGATTIKVQNPERDNLQQTRLRQTLSRSEAGTIYVYDKGPKTQRLRASWSELRDSEKADLESFFENQANGQVNTFTLIDHFGNSWTARFLQDELEWRNFDDETDVESTFSSGGTSYPTTSRKNGVWGVEIELEVS